MKRLQMFATAGMTLAILLTLTLSLHATTRLVPQQYVTIQSALDSSNAGDTVMVAPGIYATSTNGEAFPIVMKSGTTLASVSGPVSTWLQANSNTEVVLCLDDSLPTTIAGFRITHGSTYQGGGINCIRSDVRITGNEIVQNAAALGGGVAVDHSNVYLVGNTISQNAAAHGAGVYCFGSNLEAYGNTIDSNSLYAGYNGSSRGGGLLADSCSVSIRDNIISDNVVLIAGWPPTAYGGGAYLSTCTGEVVQNAFDRNLIYGVWNRLIGATIGGAGLYCRNGYEMRFDSNTFVQDSIRIPDQSWNLGAGMMLDYCFNPQVSCNTFSGMTLSLYGLFNGAGIYISNSINANVVRNTLQDCTGNGITIANSTATVSSTIVSTTVGKGISWDLASTVVVDHCDVWHSDAGNFEGALAGIGDTLWGHNRNGTACDQYQNFSLDPLISGSDGRLTENSPCIDAGNPLLTYDPDNTIADIGAAYYPHVPTDVGDDEPALPQAFAVHQNYPNPFNPSTTIAYDLPRASDVTLTIYNVLGETVYQWHAQQAAGHHQYSWDGTDASGKAVAANIYFYKLQAGDFTQTKKMVLLK